MDPTKTMTLGEHLEELRLRIILAFLALILSGCICFYYADILLQIILNPFLLVMKEQGYIPRVVQNNIAGAFLAHMKVALLAGFFFASPFIFYQGWTFVGAGLYPHEKKYIYLFAPLSMGCFILGVLFFYYIVLPFGLRFLIAYGNSAENQFIEPLITINDYFSFFVVLSLVLGFTFEVPIIMGFLSKSGIIQSEVFQKQKKIFILVAFTLAAILTPPDVATQILVAIPMIALYQVGILLTRYLEGKEHSKKEIFLMTLIPFLLVGMVFIASKTVLQESKFRTTPIEETLSTLLLGASSPFFSGQKEEDYLAFYQEASQDPKPLTRLQALQKLKSLFFKEKEEWFKSALEDPDLGIRIFATTVLKEEFHSSLGISILVAELKSLAPKNRLAVFPLLFYWSQNAFGYDPLLPPEKQKSALEQWNVWALSQTKK